MVMMMMDGWLEEPNNLGLSAKIIFAVRQKSYCVMEKGRESERVLCATQLQNRHFS